MYAVFRSGGKQYRAAKGDVLRVEKIAGDEGATVKFDQVLLVGEGSDIKVGSPTQRRARERHPMPIRRCP